LVEIRALLEAIAGAVRGAYTAGRRCPMVRKVLIGLGALAIGSAAAGQMPVTQMEAVSGIAGMDKTTQTEDVRFRNEYYDRMTVPVSVQGTGPYRFLVDTGADRTAVSSDLVNRLGLAAGNAASLHSIAGVSTVATATVPDLQLTRMPVRVVDAPVLDRSNMGADGILGVDSLRSQRIVFDFEGQTMSIVPSAAREVQNDPDAIVIQAARRSGRLVVTEANVNGRKLTVVLDTGAQVSVGNDALRQQLLGRKTPRDAQMVELQSVTGDKLSGEYTFIRELNLGGVTLSNLAVVFADAHTFKQLKLNDKPALLLGMNAMRAFKKVSIDFANRKFRVLLPEHSALDTELASGRFRTGSRPPVGR
jgi:predicted aspartyl protease